MRSCGYGCTGVGVCLCACSLTYPVCHAQAPCFLRPLSLRLNFRHYLINGTIYGKNLLFIKCVFWFFLQLLFETFLILRINQRDFVIKRLHVKYFCQILIKLEFSRQVFEKVSNIKFYQTSFSGSRVVLCGQTDWKADGRMDVTKLIVAFRNFANTPKHVFYIYTYDLFIISLNLGSQNYSRPARIPKTDSLRPSALWLLSLSKNSLRSFFILVTGQTINCAVPLALLTK